MNETTSDHSFSRRSRLRSSRQFDVVYATRIRVSNEWMMVCVRRNELSESRLGLSVSKRVGGAVVRNRWKRLIREAFRLQKSTLPRGFDFIVIPKRQEKMPSLDNVLCSVHDLLSWAARKAKNAFNKDPNY